MPAGTIAPARPRKIVVLSRSIASQMSAAWPRLRAWKALPASRWAMSAAEAESVMTNGVTSPGRPSCMSGLAWGSDGGLGGLKAALQHVHLHLTQAKAASQIIDDGSGIERLAGEDIRPDQATFREGV